MSWKKIGKKTIETILNNVLQLLNQPSMITKGNIILYQACMYAFHAPIVSKDVMSFF